nr:hypothetical protein [Dipteran tombus-related virus]
MRRNNHRNRYPPVQANPYEYAMPFVPPPPLMSINPFYPFNMYNAYAAPPPSSSYHTPTISSHQSYYTPPFIHSPHSSPRHSRNSSIATDATTQQIQQLQQQNEQLKQQLEQIQSIVVNQKKQEETNELLRTTVEQLAAAFAKLTEKLTLPAEIEDRHVTARANTQRTVASMNEKNMEPTTEECKAFLLTRSQGRVIDQDYLPYVTSLIREYLSIRKPVDYHRQADIIKIVTREHIQDIKNPIPTLNTDAIQEYNDAISFIQRCYMRIGNYFLEFPFFSRHITNPLNAQGPVYFGHQFKPLSTFLMASGLIMGGYVAARSFTRLSSHAINTIITLSVKKPFSALCSIVTAPLQLLNMTADCLTKSINYAASKLNPIPTPPTSTSIAWTTVVNATTTAASYLTSAVANVFHQSYALLPSSRSVAQTSIKLLDSSKVATQLLTSYMGATLNHLKEASNIGYNLAKELTIRLLPKCTHYLSATSTTLNSIIVPSMLTLLLKCSNLSINFISLAMTTTITCASYAKEPLTTFVLDAMVKNTPSKERVCQVTSTLLSVIASSTTTYSKAAYPILKSAAKSLSTAMTPYFSHMNQYLPNNLPSASAPTTWSPRLHILPPPFILYPFVEQSSSIIPTDPLQWLLTLIASETSTECLIADILQSNTNVIVDSYIIPIILLT